MIIASVLSIDRIRASMFLIKAALVRPWPRCFVSRRWNSTYVLCSYRTISRTDGIGGVWRLAKALVWFGGNGTLVKVPKSSHSFLTRVMGVHGAVWFSALMAVSVAGRERWFGCVFLSGLRCEKPFHFLNREKVMTCYVTSGLFIIVWSHFISVIQDIEVLRKFLLAS